MKSVFAAAITAPVTLTTAHTALAQRDMDCSDFRTWREAQDFYERSGPGDPHGLDRDRDGIACEALR